MTQEEIDQQTHAHDGYLVIATNSRLTIGEILPPSEPPQNREGDAHLFKIAWRVVSLSSLDELEAQVGRSRTPLSHMNFYRVEAVD